MTHPFLWAALMNFWEKNEIHFVGISIPDKMFSVSIKSDQTWGSYFEKKKSELVYTICPLMRRQQNQAEWDCVFQPEAIPTP